jgi:hypothetical protein
MINVLFAGPAVDSSGIESVSLPETRSSDTCHCANGEKVWLQARWRPMYADEIASIEAHSHEFDGFRTDTPFEQMNAWTIWVATGEEFTLLIQIPLGRRQLT